LITQIPKLREDAAPVPSAVSPVDYIISIQFNLYTTSLAPWHIGTFDKQLSFIITPHYKNYFSNFLQANYFVVYLCDVIS
jgi:hypothetical protein